MAVAQPPKVLTAKGAQRSEQVLEAAIRCLGEDGYAGTSLQRVADAAGVQKRMVLYYFGSRERLMAAALERLADGFLTDLEQRVAGVNRPEALVDALLDVVLEQVEDRPLIAAYYGLAAESATDPVLRDALDALHSRAQAIANEVLDTLEAHGHELSAQRELMLLAGTVAAHGLGLELLQRDLTPELERAIAFARVGVPMLLFD